MIHLTGEARPGPHVTGRPGHARLPKPPPTTTPPLPPRDGCGAGCRGPGGLRAPEPRSSGSYPCLASRPFWCPTRMPGVTRRSTPVTWNHGAALVMEDLPKRWALSPLPTSQSLLGRPEPARDDAQPPRSSLARPAGCQEIAASCFEMVAVDRRRPLEDRGPGRIFGVRRPLRRHRAMRGWVLRLLVTFSGHPEPICPPCTGSLLSRLSATATEDSRLLGYAPRSWLPGLVFAGYQTPNFPSLAGSGRFARERLQDLLLGPVPRRAQRLPDRWHHLVVSR